MLGSSGIGWLLEQAGSSVSLPALLLVLARIVGLVWTAPALATPGLGARFRFVLAVSLTALVRAAGRSELAAERRRGRTGVGSRPWG